MRLPEVLYHGTSDGYLDQMLRDGLRPAYLDDHLCFTDEEEVAVHHAHCMADWDSDVLEKECAAIVFSIPIALFDLDGFCVEHKFIENGPSGGRACNRAMTDHIKERNLVQPWTWRELLDYAGAVGYLKPLPVGRELLRVLPAVMAPETGR